MKVFYFYTITLITTQFPLLTWTENKMNTEIIVGVAHRYTNGDKEITYSLPKPNRHGDIYKTYHPLHLLDEGYDETQGFYTSVGRFVDRVEALDIANNANQIIKKHPSYDQLYSEDVW